MKILMMEWDSFGTEDIVSAFQEMGHSVKRVPFARKELRFEEKAVNGITKEIREYSPDFVFTFNYFPIISHACKLTDSKYAAWVYDSPYVLLYSYTLIYPGNYVFIFDKEWCQEFQNAGIKTVYYLPMAANVDRLNGMTDYAAFEKTGWKNQTDIAFVGSLYTEKHQFYNRLKGIKPYTRGYLEGIIAAQKQVYGYNFIQKLLTPEILEDLKQSLPMQPGHDSVESIEYLYAQYVVNRQITALERSELLTAIGEQHPFDLYTPDHTFILPGGINHGLVDYYDMAPYVFKQAKINLNISLRSIKSGMPLRIFDIMGAGGFLLTNFQADFLEYFVAGEDFVFYESKEDLLDKINYYLSHEEERAAIARSGYEKIVKGHTYKDRILEILSYL